jgi:hypothetical protein
MTSNKLQKDFISFNQEIKIREIIEETLSPVVFKLYQDMDNIKSNSK